MVEFTIENEKGKFNIKANAIGTYRRLSKDAMQEYFAFFNNTTNFEIGVMCHIMKEDFIKWNALTFSERSIYDMLNFDEISRKLGNAQVVVDPEHQGDFILRLESTSVYLFRDCEMYILDADNKSKRFAIHSHFRSHAGSRSVNCRLIRIFFVNGVLCWAPKHE